MSNDEVLLSLSFDIPCSFNLTLSHNNFLRRHLAFKLSNQIRR